MSLYNLEITDPITITTTEQNFVYLIKNLRNPNVYIINEGETEVFYQILGSPSGITTDQISSTGSIPSASDISRQYFNIETNSLLSNTKKIIDIPRAYNYLKISLWTNAGSSTIKYWLVNEGDSA